MGFSVIFGLIMQIIGPFLGELIKKLFDKWFKKAKPNLMKLGDPTTMAPEKAVGMFFEELDTVLPRIAPARRLTLGIIKRIAVKHSAKIMKGEPIVLTTDELNELGHLEKVVAKELG